MFLTMKAHIHRASIYNKPHFSTKQHKAFANRYSNVRVVRSISRFDGRSLSYALVRSNCNKLVITWPSGAWLIYRPRGLAPSGDKSASALVTMLYYYIDPVAMVTCV